MLNSNKPLSKNSTQYIGVISLILSILLVIVAGYKSEAVWYISTGVIGFPLVLMSLSLLFGQAKKGNGILTSTSLYFLGLVITLALIAAKFSGVTINPVIIIIPLTLFGLALTRKSKK